MTEASVPEFSCQEFYLIYAKHYPDQDADDSSNAETS